MISPGALLRLLSIIANHWPTEQTGREWVGGWGKMQMLTGNEVFCGGGVT